MIGPDQLAYMQGRSVTEGHMLINRALELCRSKKIQGVMATIDFQGAFNTVNHNFLWQTMEKMNVGNGFINHLKTLYHGAKSAVLNFGTQTNWIEIQRSVRQGDPVSSYLFIIAMEALLCKLRRTISPIGYKKFTLSMISYSDDLTIFVPNEDELKEAINTVQSFEFASGLKINLDKSEVMSLGVPVSDRSTNER